MRPEGIGVIGGQDIVDGSLFGYVSGEVGSVTIAGVNARRKIAVFDAYDLDNLRFWRWSRLDGSWRVNGIPTGTVAMVLAQDYELQFNSVVRDNITPAPIS